MKSLSDRFGAAVVQLAPWPKGLITPTTRYRAAAPASNPRTARTGMPGNP